jgi:hypothetical protein
MRDGAPSTLAVAMTWMALILTCALLALGGYRYGFSLDVHQRFWSDIADRIHGPMTFRFYLQPTMALIAAIPDGINDARNGHSAFFWTAHGDPDVRHGRLREGLTATARIVLLGLSMDVIYQYRVLDHFYPAEAAVMAIMLAVIPYFVFRWIVERAAAWWLAPGSAAS